jgi:hypothetical protein
MDGVFPWRYISLYEGQATEQYNILPRTSNLKDFFYFSLFINKIREMNSVKTHFQDMAIWSHVSPIGVTHEGVTSYALAQLGWTRGAGVCQDTDVAPCRHQSRQRV